MRKARHVNKLQARTSCHHLVICKRKITTFRILVNLERNTAFNRLLHATFGAAACMYIKHLDVKHTYTNTLYRTTDTRGKEILVTVKKMNKYKSEEITVIFTHDAARKTAAHESQIYTHTEKKRNEYNEEANPSRTRLMGRCGLLRIQSQRTSAVLLPAPKLEPFLEVLSLSGTDNTWP